MWNAPRFMITITICLLVFTKCCTAGLFAEYAKNDSHKMAVKEYNLNYLGFKQNKQTLAVDSSSHVSYPIV